MTIQELPCSVRFSDTNGHQVSMRLRSERNKDGTEEPGWFIGPLSSCIYSGPFCGFRGEVYDHICITHLAIQSMPTKRPAYRIAWIPLLDKFGGVAAYLHLYNKYQDAASNPTAFRIQERWNKGTHDKEPYEEYTL